VSGRREVSSGAEWEDRYGYRRAVRIGDVVAVSGTTAPGPDAYTQARVAFATALAALAALGGRPEDVLRTRMFVVDIAEADAVGRAHAEAFGGCPPAATMVEVSALIAPELLVEVELDAVVGVPTGP
jgi:enamine deaminase RidA (YjgF/YER057c/UK114 family)